MIAGDLGTVSELNARARADRVAAGHVTQAAGRGVGMDVVATEVKKLGAGLFIAQCTTSTQCVNKSVIAPPPKFQNQRHRLYFSSS